MQPVTKTIAPSLKALLAGFIDYAGVFPPAALTLGVALENYERYRSCDQSWMLRWFVVEAKELGNIPSSLDGLLSVLADSDQARAATLETKGILQAERPVYCEVALNELAKLEAVKKSGCFAKIRTGGLKPEAIPSPAEVAAFINSCKTLRLPFKATAGLHHPLRADYPLTYQADAPWATMHGFVNVLMASAFAWQGEANIEPIIAETDRQAFSFDEKAHWRGLSLTVDEIKSARRDFVHSVGSCSFEEPIEDLCKWGLL